MNLRPYQLIVVLLSVSILGVLVLQGFWMQRFYNQKQNEFTTRVHGVLASAGKKLNEGENLQVIKHSFSLDSSSSTKTSRTRVVVSGTGPSHISAPPLPSNSPNQLMQTDSLSWENEIVVYDTSSEGAGSARKIVLNNKSAGWTAKKTEIKQLLNKLKVDMEVLESSYLENISEAQLTRLLKKELQHAGINSPFEFSLKNETDKTTDVIAQSKGFDTSKTQFKSDLSINRVFPTNNYLYLQFPHQNNIVLSGMQRMIGLSLFFSVLILGVFYYSIHLLLKQKKLSDIKNDFINNMTHELKTPIATISLAADAISNPLIKNDAEKFRTYTQIVKEENQKLNRHVERVLQIAMIDKGELQLSKTQLNIIQLIREVNQSYNLLMKQAGAECRFQPAQEDLLLFGDEFHFRNLLSNLLDNALKYSKETPKITWTCTKIKDTLEIRIKDNGIGIADDKKNKVFEKFYREQGGNLHDVKGFGLGLSYAKSIVEAHGGSIELLSEKGSGSEFILKFKTDA